MGRKIAIVGAGAVGGYAGAHMVQAGEDVTFIDPWPEHVEHMRKHGLRVTHARDVPEFTVPVRALHVTDAIFQNAVEERPPLLRRAIRVGASQLQHRILHGIERIVLMAQRRLRDLECLKFDAGQKLVERTRLGRGFRVRKVHVAVYCDRRVINRRERSKATHGSYNARASPAVDPLRTHKQVTDYSTLLGP